MEQLGASNQAKYPASRHETTHHILRKDFNALNQTACFVTQTTSGYETPSVCSRDHPGMPFRQLTSPRVATALWRLRAQLR